MYQYWEEASCTSRHRLRVASDSMQQLGKDLALTTDGLAGRGPCYMWRLPALGCLHMARCTDAGGRGCHGVRHGGLGHQAAEHG